MRMRIWFFHYYQVYFDCLFLWANQIALQNLSQTPKVLKTRVCVLRAYKNMITHILVFYAHILPLVTIAQLYI
jgi:uncharacterized membrane protein YwaF